MDRFFLGKVTSYNSDLSVKIQLFHFFITRCQVAVFLTIYITNGFIVFANYFSSAHVILEFCIMEKSAWHSVDLQKHLVNTRESSFAVIEYWKYQLIKKIPFPSPLSRRGNKEILIFKNKDNAHFCLNTAKCVICRLIEKTSKKNIFLFLFVPTLFFFFFILGCVPSKT